MEHSPTFSQVPFGAIDLHDARYILAPLTDPPEPYLIASIQTFGILHPPLLLEHGPDRYIVVSGRKRVTAYGGNDVQRPVQALVIPAGTTEAGILSVLLEYRNPHDPLSVAEQVSFLAKATEVFSQDDLLGILRRLGHQPSGHKLQEILQLQNLDHLALLCLHEGTIKYGNALRLVRLVQHDQRTVTALIQRFRLGGSKQQQLIDLAAELIRRRNMGLPEILDELGITHDPAQPDNLPQQAAILLKKLHQACFPRSSQAEGDFNKRIAQLELPANMDVQHTPSFENEEVTLAIRLAGLDTLEKVAALIKGLKR